MTSKALQDAAIEAQSNNSSQPGGAVQQQNDFMNDFNIATQGMDEVNKKIAFDRYNSYLIEAAGDNVELLNAWQQQIAPSAPKLKERGISGALSDWYGQAALTIDKTQQPFYQLNSPTSENAINNQTQIDAGYAGLSDEARYREYQAQKRMSDAKSNDTSSVAAWLKNLASNPVSTATDLVSSALPAALVAGANVAGTALTAATLGAAAPVQAAIAAATPAALAAIGAAQSVGSARGDLFDKVMNADDATLLQSSPKYLELRQSLSEQDAKNQLGTNWQEHIPEFIAQASVGALTGRLGGVIGGSGKSIGREVLSEGVGEYGQQVLSNAAYKRIDENQSLTEDALLAGVQGAAGGGLVYGAAVSLPDYLSNKYGAPVVDPLSQAMSLSGTAEPIQVPEVIQAQKVASTSYSDEQAIQDEIARINDIALKSQNDMQSNQPKTLEQMAVEELGAGSTSATDAIQEAAQGVTKSDSLADDTRARLESLQSLMPKDTSAFKIVESYKSRPIIENNIDPVASPTVYDYDGAKSEIASAIDNLSRGVTNTDSINIVGTLKSLGGVNIKERSDLTGERGIEASKKFPALFKNKARSLHDTLNDGLLNDYLPQTLKVSSGQDTSAAYNYISDVLRGNNLIESSVSTDTQNEIDSLQYALDGLDVMRKNDDAYINYQARNASQVNDGADQFVVSTRAPYDTLQSLPQPVSNKTYQQKNVDDAVALLASVKRLPITENQNQVKLYSIFEEWKNYVPRENADSLNRIVTEVNRSRPKQSNIDSANNRIDTGEPKVTDSAIGNVQEPRAELASIKQPADLQQATAGNDAGRADGQDSNKLRKSITKGEENVQDRYSSPDFGELRQPGGVRGGAGLLAIDNGKKQSVRGFGQSLQGLEGRVKVNGEYREFGAYAKAQEVAQKYAQESGIDYRPVVKYVKVDEARAILIANEFDAMDHNPNDPLVKESYSAMVKETIEQYKFILQSGLKIEFIDGDNPYKNPRELIIDAVENNHLWVYRHNNTQYTSN